MVPLRRLPFAPARCTRAPLLESAGIRSVATATTKRKVLVCTDLGASLSLLTKRPDLEVVAWPDRARECPRPWLLEHVPGTSGLVVCFKEQIDQELLAVVGPNLRVVSTISVGYDHINLPLLAERRVRLGYTPDVLTDAVADSAVMLALMASRRTTLTTGLVADAESGWPAFQWTPFALAAPQVSTTRFAPRRTAGFLGFGRIAHAVLRCLALGFGITHAIYTPRPGAPPQTARDQSLLRACAPALHALTPVPLPALAAQSDLLFVLAPGGAATHNLVDAAFLRRMRRTAVLVNNGRGSVVDSHALAHALKEGWIWGAGLDVVQEEPRVAPGHPLLADGVRDKCVIVPHLGSATFETREEMARITAANTLAGLDGEEMESELDLGRNRRN